MHKMTQRLFFVYALVIFAFTPLVAQGKSDPMCGRYLGRGLYVSCVMPRLVHDASHRPSRARGPFGIYGEPQRIAARRPVKMRRMVALKVAPVSVAGNKR